MSQFIETIAVVSGKARYLNWHQKRVNATFAFHFPTKLPIDLSSFVSSLDLPKQGKYKLRLRYGFAFESYDLELYRPKSIRSVALVEVPSFFDYSFKYADRRFLQSCVEQVKEDEVWLVKNEFLTDFSYANVLLFDGQSYYTPQHCLLKGSCRQRLLSTQKVKEISLKPEDLESFEWVAPLNALLDLGEGNQIPMCSVRFPKS